MAQLPASNDSINIAQQQQQERPQYGGGQAPYGQAPYGPPYGQPAYGGGGGQQQQQQVVIIGQPGEQKSKRAREWSTGVCGCFEDCSSCVYAFFCFPCFTCTLASEMNECPLGPYCFGRLFLMAMRTKVRTLYNIHGSILKDICCMLWCDFCVTLQMHRELKNMQQLV